MKFARLTLSLMMILASMLGMAQIAPICDVECTPDPNSPTYTGAVVARPKLLNARGFSSPIQMTAGPLQVPMIVGSQSYNYIIPILSLPGRAGMDLNLNLYYNSRVWDIDNMNWVATFNADRDFPSYGFRLDFGYVEYDPYGDQFILTERDGTKHALPGISGYNSTDGTYINYNPANNVLTYKNGITVQYVPFPATANLYRPTQIKDTNGNYISIAYVSGHDQLIQSITDTLGRIVNFHYDGSSRLSYIDQNVAVSTVDPTGVHRYVTFTWSTLYGGGYGWYNFTGLAVNGTPDLATSLNVLTGCTYANSTGYRFTYGDWAIIRKIENLSATGITRSYASYNYPLASAGALTDAPTYTQQTISPDGLDTNTSVWTYAATKNGTGVVTSMQVTDPLGNVSITNLDQTSGLASSVQIKNSSGSLLRTSNFGWTTSGGASVPGSVSTTLNDTGQQSSVQYSNYDAFGNVGDVYEYDFGGQLLRHTVTTYATTRFGPQHILNLPTQVLVKDGAGNTITRTDFDYDSTSITNITDAANHDNSLLVHGNLTSITRYADAANGGNSFVRHFFYDSTGNVRTAEVDCCNQKVFNFDIASQYAYPSSMVRGPSGLQFTTSATFNYDKGLLASITDENNQVINYQYDSMNRTTQVLLPPQGGTRVQVNTGYDDVAASPTVTRSTTANSSVAVTTLDGLDHTMRVDNKNGTTVVSSVTYGYDKLWQRTQASNPFAPADTVLNTVFTFDALGRITQTTPPSAGYVLYQYSGSAVTITDPAGKQRKRISDALGRLIEVDEPGESFAGSASRGSLNIGGTLRSTVTGGQNATQATATIHMTGEPGNCDVGYVFMSAGSVTTPGITYACGFTAQQMAQALISYFSSTQVTATFQAGSGPDDCYIIFRAIQAGASGNTIPFSFSYQSLVPGFPPPYNFSPNSGNLSGGQDAVGGTTVWDSGTVNVTVGGFTASAPYSQTGNSTAAMVVTALVGTGPTGLNRAGSPVQATANGSSISFTYNTVGAAGNVSVTATSSPDNPSLFPGGSFSGSNVLTGGVDPYSSGLAHPYATTYSYDVMNNVTAVSQAAGLVNGQQVSGQPRSFAFDSLGRPLTATTPESGMVTTYYTTSGGATCAGDTSLPCRIQDARGVIKTFSYDAINRPIGVTYSDGTPPVTYQYDTGGAAAFALDRLTKVTEGPASPTPVNSHTLTYDNLGRVLSDSQSIDQRTYLIRYAYNLASQIISTTYPSGRVVLQNYDAIGRVCAVGASGSTCTTGTRYLSSPTYNAAGETLGLSLGNGVQGTFTYNDHLQLASVHYAKGSTDILNLGYDYTTGVPGNNGQIQKVHYYTSPGVEDLTKSENFTYDSLGRLSAAQTGVVNSTPGAKTWSLTWSYDRLGNRLSQSMVGGDPNLPLGGPNLLMDQATNRIVGYCYDQAGNLLDDASCPGGNHKYTYDGANRLTKINTTAAVYSYFGPQRIKKVVGSTTTRYIYSRGKPIAEYVGATNPSLSAEYIYAGSKLLVTIAGSTTTYHHPDHLSNRAESNSSGTRTRTFGHAPFGETWYETGTADKWKFTSYENDSATGETGLNYAQFRHHAPTQGRFMSADPMSGSLGSPQSLNRYSYTMNDPVNLVDPTGLFIICLGWFHSDDGGETWTLTSVVGCWDTDGGGSHAPLVDGSGGGGGGGGGDGAGGDKSKKPPKDPCPSNIRNFFDKLGSIFTDMAKQTGVDARFFAALSAVESGWLGQHAQDKKNPFGLTNAGGNDLGFGSYKAAENYWLNDAARDRQGYADVVRDDKTISDFANDLHDAGYNNKTGDWTDRIIDQLPSIDKWMKICNVKL